MAGQGAEGDKKKSGAGHWNTGPCSIYKFQRRSESSKPWRSRYTPSWKSLYKDWTLRLGSRRGTIYSNAASQLDHRRATLSRSSVRMAPESNLEAKYAKWQLNTNFKAEISPSRAGAPMHADALDAQRGNRQEYHNSGGGRTEKTREQLKRQQIVRSENDNRTGARERKITTGMASADGWTTFPAKRQVAAIEMRVGQNGGPLPSEAIIDLGAPIINNLPEVATKLTATVRDASALKSQHESVQFRNRRTLRAFFATKLRTRIPTSGVFCTSFYAEEKDAMGERCREGLRQGRAMRSENRGEPDRVLRLRDARLLAGEAPGEVEGDADGHGSWRKDATVERCREGLRLGRAVRNANKIKPTKVLRLRDARLLAGEAQVEAEGDEVTLPVEEPMTATTL